MSRPTGSAPPGDGNRSCDPPPEGEGESVSWMGVWWGWKLGDLWTPRCGWGWC